MKLLTQNLPLPNRVLRRFVFAISAFALTATMLPQTAEAGERKVVKRNYEQYDGDEYRDRSSRDRKYRDRNYRDRNYRDRGYRDRSYKNRKYNNRGYRDNGYRSRDYYRNFKAPKRIHRQNYHSYNKFFLGELFFRPHRHFHTVFRFPFYSGNKLSYRPYAYCEGEYYGVGRFNEYGPSFDEPGYPQSPYRY